VTDRSGGATGRIATLVALLLLLAGGAWWWTRGPGGNPGGDPVGGPVAKVLDAAAAREVASRTNVALGLLENQALDEAIPLFEALRETVPAEPLPHRNLAVARTVALGDGGAEPAPEAVAAATLALAEADRVEGPSTDLLWLRARAAQASRDLPAWREATARLTEKLPADAAAWYERWRASRDDAPGGGQAGPATGGPGATLAPALDKALELDPRNLWLVIEWCRSLALELGKRPAPPVPDGLAGALEARWPAMQPFAPTIRTFANVDVRDLLDKAIAAAGAGDAAGVAGRLRGIANVLVPQSEADRRAIERHPLEFVLERYRPAFYRDSGLDAPASSSSVAVTFENDGDAVPTGAPAAAVVLEDFDLDGDAEMILLDGRQVRVLSRDGAARAWREIATAEVPEGMRGIVAADLDLDFDEAKRPGMPVAPGTDPPGADFAAARRAAGCPAADLDLVVFGDGGLALLENFLDPAAGTRSLRPFAGEAPAGTTHAAAVADLDADGYLDLVCGGDAGLRLFRNLGKGAFLPWPGQAEVAVGTPVRGLVALDWDRDVDVDVIVAGDGGAGVLENLLHGQFRYGALAGVTGALSGVDVVDADADGAWDLLVSGADGVRLVASKRGATGVVRMADGPAATVLPGATTGIVAFDADNDGVLDAAATGPGGLVLVRGAADGTFAAGGTLAPGPAGPADVADLDADGDLEVAVATPAGVVVLGNRGGNANHWMDVALEAQQIKGSGVTASGRVNAHGLGSLLELKAGDRYQPRPVRRRTTHFGLGALPEADVVRVAWINGVPQNVIRPPADALFCEEQILLGSCPYLYVWDGERFVFATDLLWGAPLGLQRSEGVLMPSRPREWLKIDPPMAPRDGRYELRVTEELWEAAYFDSLRLHVVDHPADVVIHSNEKVGPAEIAPFRIHTVRTPIAPRAARDGVGADVLAEIAAADGRFAPTIRGKLRQGLVSENVLELDFGTIADPASATLFLTGWIYPTTVSENVGLSHDPLLSLPRPPWLSVPDGTGGWREAIPFTGFPGGKTKTIAIDVSGLLDRASARLRIATTMEIRWDAAFLSSGETPAEVRAIVLEPERATLAFRGRSRIEQDDSGGPERFLHGVVSREPRWPPMRGAFTAYGEVGELVAADDDRLVVMGAGDEMALVFPVPEGPPAGWRRSFLLESVGWDKDANLATAEGQTVEPLPFRAMRSYPPAEDDLPESTPARDEWLRRWQWRRQDEAYWSLIRRWPPDRVTLERRAGADPPGDDRPGGMPTRRSER